ncbi:MAG: hypothetical protein V3T83_04785, partial [Acidobacteriota bacterium]
MAHVVSMADQVVAGKIHLFRLGDQEVDPLAPGWQIQSDQTRWRLLGRHDFLVFIALAFAYTEREEYREALLAYLQSWLSGRGDRRCEKSIDAANRLVNWAWLRQIPGLLDTMPDIWPSWAETVRSDARHILSNLSLGGNHLALDGLGLWAAGISHP